MIRLILQGGLGNQMFEYSTALAVAEEYGHSIEIDMSFFDNYSNRSWCRQYGLSIFYLNGKTLVSHRFRFLVKILPRLSLFCRKHGICHIGPLFFEIKQIGDIKPEMRNIIFFWLFQQFTYI